MIHYNKEVGKRIYKARKDLGLTLKEFGKLVDLHESTVKRYESGDIKTLDIDKLKEFSNALKVTPIYLLGWEEDEEYNN